MLVGRQATEDLVPHRLGAHALDERLDDAEIDVRFEQRQTDFTQRRVDVLFREPGLTPDRLEDTLETVAERLEHDTRPGRALLALTDSRANSYDSRSLPALLARAWCVPYLFEDHSLGLVRA